MALLNAKSKEAKEQSQSARDAYVLKYMAINGILSEITESVGDIRCPEEGDKVHWGEVGDLGRIELMLADVRDLLDEINAR